MKKMVLAMVTMFLGLTAAVVATPVSDGQYYATNFENPPFVPGSIASQDGWYGNLTTVGDAGLGLGSQTMNEAASPNAYAFHNLGNVWAYSNSWVMSFTYWYAPGQVGYDRKFIALTDTGLAADGETLVWLNQGTNVTSPTDLTIAPLPAVNHFVIQRMGNMTARVWLNGVEGTSTTIGTSVHHDSDGYLELGNMGPVAQYYDDLSIGEPIPEPATISLLVLGLCGLLRRRK